MSVRAKPGQNLKISSISLCLVKKNGNEMRVGIRNKAFRIHSADNFLIFFNLKIFDKDHSRGNPEGRPRLLRGLRQTVHAAWHSLRAHAQGAQPGTGNGRPEQVQPPEVAVLCGPRSDIPDISRTCEQRGTICDGRIGQLVLCRYC